MLVFETDEQAKTLAKAAVNITELELKIGGESVIRTDVLTLPSHQGARATPDLVAAAGADSGVGLWAILQQYLYLDFRKQAWDCRGKSVTLEVTAGSTAALRFYPIYLVDM